jgi:hypothetical protein
MSSKIVMAVAQKKLKFCSTHRMLIDSRTCIFGKLFRKQHTHSLSLMYYSYSSSYMMEAKDEKEAGIV